MMESSDRPSVLQGRVYYVEVRNQGTYWMMGRIVSPGVRFRGTRYWAMWGRGVIHLIDPDDVIEVKEVKDYG